MYVEILKKDNLDKLNLSVKEFISKKEIIIVSQLNFFDRVDEKETTIICYYL